MDDNKMAVGKCPVCGADVVKVRNGYRCTTSIADRTQCSFFLGSLVGNRHISDSEARTLLADSEILLDGFSTKEGRVFTTVLHLLNDGTVKMDSVVAQCPKCGGNLHAGPRAFNCANYSNQEAPCNFAIWRNVSGHDFTLAEVRELCQNGAIANPVDQFNDLGNFENALFGLSPEKDKVVKI